MRTFLVTERVNYDSAGNGMETKRFHIVTAGEVAPHSLIIGTHDPFSPVGGNPALVIMAGMKQQRRVALDADVADSQESRAGGLAMAHNTKQFAACLDHAEYAVQARGRPRTLSGSLPPRWLKLVFLILTADIVNLLGPKSARSCRSLSYSITRSARGIRNNNTYRARGLHIDRQLDQRRLFDRNVSRLGFRKHLLYVGRGKSVAVPPGGAVPDQAPASVNSGIEEDDGGRCGNASPATRAGRSVLRLNGFKR